MALSHLDEELHPERISTLRRGGAKSLSLLSIDSQERYGRQLPGGDNREQNYSGTVRNKAVHQSQVFSKGSGD